ncbi:MAG: hypothetical protein ACTXOO_04585 [Sodalis sp. (in: enterobacteria)]
MGYLAEIVAPNSLMPQQREIGRDRQNICRHPIVPHIPYPLSEREAAMAKTPTVAINHWIGTGSDIIRQPFFL